MSYRPDNNPNYFKMYTSTPGLFGQGRLNLGEIEDKKDKKDKYDPYGYFLYSKGIHNHNSVTQYHTNYFNIDSSYRKKEISAVYEENSYITLNNRDPFRVFADKKILRIYHDKHNYLNNDKISIKNLSAPTRIIRTIVNSSYKIIFTTGSEYLKIETPHNLYFDNATDAFNYETTINKNLQVSFDGFKGDPGINFINNIPINELNKTHKIYLVNPENLSEYSDNAFYIKLPFEFQDSYTSSTGYNIKITFMYIAGIPINEINAEFPINKKHVQGFHYIKNVQKKYYEISLKTLPNIQTSDEYFDFGGANIQIGKIKEILNGFPNPNNYVINLDKNYNNVVKIRIISSEFPNVKKIIKNTGTCLKNKFYWQNQRDGDYVYSVSIENGSYEIEDLVEELEEKILQTPRIQDLTTEDNLMTDYNNKNIIKIDLEKHTNIATFRSYSEAILERPIIGVNPIIDINTTTILTEDQEYVLTIEQHNHGLLENDIIIIKNAIAHLGIPAEIINGEHVVREVIDNNKYTIVLHNFNLEETKTETRGGMNFQIWVPNKIRLRFDYSDTIGETLGFSKTGTPEAITPFKTVITNKDLYEQEIQAEDNYCKNKRAFKLVSDKYFFMQITDKKDLNQCSSSGPIKEYFYKFQTHVNGGNTDDNLIMNSYVDTPLYFHDPYSNLDKFEIKFLDEAGNLYDFFGLDHSLTLEITTISEVNLGTNISTKYPKLN